MTKVTVPTNKFMTAESFARLYIECPCCKGPIEYTQLAKMEDPVGLVERIGPPSNCETCGVQYCLRWKPSQSIEIAISAEVPDKGSHEDVVYVLLSTTDLDPTFFIAEQRWNSEDVQKKRDIPGHGPMEFYYEENCIPSNWLKNVVGVYKSDGRPNENHFLYHGLELKSEALRMMKEKGVDVDHHCFDVGQHFQHVFPEFQAN